MFKSYVVRPDLFAAQARGNKVRGFSNTNTPPNNTHRHTNIKQRAVLFIIRTHTLCSSPAHNALSKHARPLWPTRSRSTRLLAQPRLTHENARPAHTLSASQHKSVRQPPHAHTCWQSSSSSSSERAALLPPPAAAPFPALRIRRRNRVFFTFSACSLFCLEKQHSTGSITPQNARPRAPLIGKRFSGALNQKSSFWHRRVTNRQT